MTVNLQSLFAEPLVDLGEDDASLRGIFTPCSERGAEKRGVTDQFLENAADYHARYTNVDHFRVLISNALATLKPPINPRTVLDIGSGSGNSVIPLLDRFPDAFVVATDISPQLLAILRDHLAARPVYHGRFALVCMDASNDRYRVGAFDLAVGAAILHHVIEPMRVVSACGRSLGAGGAAIFFEPFEMGHAVLSLVYRDIIAEADRRGLESRGIAMLRHLVGDYAARLRSNDATALQELDDKWLFTRDYFQSMASSLDWAECHVYPIHSDVSPLTDQTVGYLQLMIGAEPSALPAWAWEALSRYESAFSEKTREELVFEGAVILRKAKTVLDAAGSGWWWNPAESGRGIFVGIRGGLVCLAFCGYDADGSPTWHAAGPVPLTNDCEMDARMHQLRLPSIGGVTEASSRNEGPRISIRFDGPRTAQWSLAATTAPLEPQHAENPGVTDGVANSRTGWWLEDTEHPESAVIVESLGDRVSAAFLSAKEWCLATGFRLGQDSFEGEWFRYHGGQAIGGPYRPPAAPQSLGEAHLSWTNANSLVVKLPGGRYRAFRRFHYS